MEPGAASGTIKNSQVVKSVWRLLGAATTAVAAMRATKTLVMVNMFAKKKKLWNESLQMLVGMVVLLVKGSGQPYLYNF